MRRRVEPSGSPDLVDLGERGADPGRDDAALGLARVRHGVSLEVHPAALARGAQHAVRRRLQTLMGVRDDQLDAA